MKRCQFSQTSLFGTKKKNESRYKLSIIGNKGVARRANAVIRKFHVSPGKISSTNTGYNHDVLIVSSSAPLLPHPPNVVLNAFCILNEERGISARGIIAN